MCDFRILHPCGVLSLCPWLQPILLHRSCNHFHLRCFRSFWPQRNRFDAAARHHDMNQNVEDSGQDIAVSADGCPWPAVFEVGIGPIGARNQGQIQLPPQPLESGDTSRTADGEQGVGQESLVLSGPTLPPRSDSLTLSTVSGGKKEVLFKNMRQ